MTTEKLPQFTMRQLLEAGVHFGHTTRRWNPKMAPYLFGEREGIHIINLQKTVPLLRDALQAVYEVVSSGGRVLFVGTKRQAAEPIAKMAERCGQYYVNHRWLGGMLTNWKTVSQSIGRMKEMEAQLADAELGLTKKELLKLQREYDKLKLSLGGIADMGGLPNIIVVIDTTKEDIAIKEANCLGIPVVGVLDSNATPDGILYPVPGNDDAMRAINLYCDLFAETVLSGIKAEMTRAGVDMGARANPMEAGLKKTKAAPKAEAEAKAETTPTAPEATEVEAAETPAAEIADEKKTSVA